VLYLVMGTAGGGGGGFKVATDTAVEELDGPGSDSHAHARSFTNERVQVPCAHVDVNRVRSSAWYVGCWN